MKKLSKAIAGALSAFGAALVTAASSGAVSQNEWLIILGATAAGFAVVYEAPANT